MSNQFITVTFEVDDMVVPAEFVEAITKLVHAGEGNLTEQDETNLDAVIDIHVRSNHE